ncbi:MAG: hypothetical protein HKM02_01370 [Pseudomonadales bacterium]|nr:hypothetical protein [Pseudomonadales bacterium]
MYAKLNDFDVEARLMKNVMQRTRTNTRIEIIVNRGLAAALLSDLETGIDIMCAGGVPAHVVKRILSDMTCRRATDWK